MPDYRIYIEKKQNFRVEAQSLCSELNTNFSLQLNHLRLLNVYDIFNCSEALLNAAKDSVFSEKNVDDVFETIDLTGKTYFAFEFLPGQFDQRADSAMQCISLINSEGKPVVKSAKLLIFDRKLDDDTLKKIKKYCINTVEAREKDLSVLEYNEDVTIEEIAVFNGFTDFSTETLSNFRQKLGLAMSLEDLQWVQQYFRNEEHRDPTETEIKMLDTYWSDHCRHTTFETVLEVSGTFEKNIGNELFLNDIRATFENYIRMRTAVHGGKKPITLMDMATICGKFERKNGRLQDMEVSDEINACSIYIDVDVNGKTEQWLLMFKNETHNHPTEIEPFGGASTCIGGAIRDPLSGRSYVYQAMRVTGSADPTEPVERTLEGKLPQSVISKTAAHGYSSYGNQIGLATTHVREIYHEGYKAKRMEVGTVVGAVPAAHVRRETPQPGDVVIMFGGRTGRDGIGGATGSSKEHSETSLEKCSAEVQKGNAPEERKIQRLFRNPEVTRLIKKSNDFGAGGVSVAIGELADGLLIDLDSVPVKYKGLNGTELAISESQERMSVVVAQADAAAFIEFCRQENIEAVEIAKITDTNRLQILWQGKMLVDLSRDFINTNGVRQTACVELNPVALSSVFKRNNKQWINHLQDLNIASQKGMIEMFDSTIGSSTVLMPFGGKNQDTEVQVSVQKIPVRHGQTDTASMLAFGFNPYISEWSPYHGAAYAILESISKIVAAGGTYDNIRFSFQEYFERLNQDAKRWGKPFAALLGAIYMQSGFGLPAIGGKDSMSGTFKDISVPPTLISFAVTVGKASQMISPEFKQMGHFIYLIKHHQTPSLMPNIEELKSNYDFISRNIQNGAIVSAFALQFGGLAEALCKMSFGNSLGFHIADNFDFFDWDYGSIVLESKVVLDFENAIYLGQVASDILVGDKALSLETLRKSWKEKFNGLFPEIKENKNTIKKIRIPAKSQKFHYPETLKPHEINVFLPVFPGTNCDYDTARAFEAEGVSTEFFVFKNLSQNDIENSIAETVKRIRKAHILVFSGGFSLGDEPDGSGKFIANILNNEKIKQAVHELLDRKGLILGICNGFQALIKSGLLPYGRLRPLTENSPTLYRNDINRHISKMVYTKVSSLNSPWLSSFDFEEVHAVAVSHGEGKFVVDADFAVKLFENHQVAFQYCDADGKISMDGNINPNGSDFAVEGLISEDGLILGKMAHSERFGENIHKNIARNKSQNIFRNAVGYFV